jgi:Uma2 family endonuclease
MALGVTWHGPYLLWYFRLAAYMQFPVKPGASLPQLWVKLMSTITPTQPMPMTLPSPSHVYRLTVDQYDRMVRDGTLDEHDPVELLGGVLVRKMPQNPEHVWAVDELGETLAARQSDAWHVRKEHPVRIPDYDEPEPDLAIVRGTRAALRGRHPGPADLYLVVEVGNTTLDDDQGVKKERYALAGIPVYWIVNLRDGRIEVYTDPDEGAGQYRHRVDFGPGEQAPVNINGIEVARIAVADLLSKRP